MTLFRRTGTKAARAYAAHRGGGPLWHFLRGFVKHPVMVGSVIPSSKMLIDKMLEPVDWANCKLFVEYGPGVGTFTQHILDRLAPDAILLTIDTNPDFTTYLTAKIRDSRLRRGDRLGRGRARDHGRSRLRRCRLRPLRPALLDPSAGIGPAIAEATADALRPGGAFLVYQFSPKVRALHRAPFRPDRPRLRMAQRSARHPVLGVEGLGRLQAGSSKPKLSRREIP